VRLDLLTAVPSNCFVPVTKELLEQSTAFDRSNSLTYTITTNSVVGFWFLDFGSWNHDP